MIAAERSWRQKVALALLGPAIIRAHPYEPLYFLPLAQKVRSAVAMPLVLLGGGRALSDIETALAAGFELVAMGRPLIHDPALIAKYQAGRQRTSGCIPCNQCVAQMEREGGVRCVRTSLPPAR